MITNLNMRKVENGYFLDYWKDGKAVQRVFYTWTELCDWLKKLKPEEYAGGTITVSNLAGYWLGNVLPAATFEESRMSLRM